MSNFDDALRRYQQRVNSALDNRLPAEDAVPALLHRAMRYACLGGGKRFRALLVYAAGEQCGAPPESIDAVAVAVELVHAYSLIHDDLPAMDDDDLRRGRATCHKAFDEATAVLAGDALQSLAFEVLASDPSLRIDAGRRLEMVAVLAQAIGASGMAGGQSLDMLATDREVDSAALQEIHTLKTGALIRASCRLGGLCAPSTSTTTLEELDEYGATLGLAFQVTDDILDVIQESGVLGKPGGADQRMQKSTYVSLLGLEGARRECAKLHQQALESADRLGDNPVLFRQLADFVVNRSF